MSNPTETTAEADALDFLENVQSYVRDMTYTINVGGDSYVTSEQFQKDLKHLQQVVAQGV